MGSKSLTALGFGVLLATAFTSWAFLAQRSLLFPGSPALPARSVDEAPRRVEQVWIETSFGRVEAWFLRAGGTRDTPTVVFAHDAGGLIDDWDQAAETLRTVGLNVLLVEFPGYGHSDGRASRLSLRETFVAAYDWLIEEPGVDPYAVTAMGVGLGAAAAGELARERPLSALVMQSAFTSTEAFVQDHLPIPRSLIRDRFDSEAAVSGFRGPVLLIHGSQDEVVSPAHAERLAALAPQSELKRLECGHDCTAHWRDSARHVRLFLEDHGVLR